MKSITAFMDNLIGPAMGGNLEQRMAEDEEKASKDALIAKQDKDIADAEARKKQEDADATSVAARAEARRRQRELSRSSQGRRGTILTGPLGLTGEATTARKTLLGV
jgi:hypothetical protein